MSEESRNSLTQGKRRTPAKRSKDVPQEPEVSWRPQEIEQTLAELFCRFREKFGRDPKENDPVFFDPHSDQPVPLGQEALNEMWERLAETLLRHGEITPATAYAMKKTGLLVTPATKNLLTAPQRRECRAALEEYSRSRELPAVSCSKLDRSTLLCRSASPRERKRS